MSGTRSLPRVGIAGLGFGAEFVPIYLHHPSVGEVWVCDTDRAVLDETVDRYGIVHAVSTLDELMAADIDAIHLVTPIPLHAEHAVRVLESGKHCACTVPMATTLDDIRKIIDARKRSGKQYMMMETAVYTREFLYVQKMVQKGELGRIQLLRGAHYQDMEGWPTYWKGLPPMHYATHAIAPLLKIANARATEVHCYGSGVMRDELVAAYGNPYPAETAIFRLEQLSENSTGPSGQLAAEVTRTLFHTARTYTESFNVYGERATFEWQQIEEEDPIVFRMQGSRGGRGNSVEFQRVQTPDVLDRLPEEIRRFTRRGVYDESNPHQSFLQGGGHGGSHPHLVHEFVSAIREGRAPSVDDIAGARITAAGISAHESAMANGTTLHVPDFV